MTPNSDLEQRVHRALTQLPTPAAPPAFAARVMSRVSAHAMPEVSPAAFEWPAALRVALTGMSFALIVGALLMWPLALEFARTAWQSPVVSLLRVAAETARPMVPAALVYITAMCVVCAAAASMLKYVALGGATNQ